MLNDVRGWAKGTLPTYADRKAFFESIVNGDPDPVELLRQGEEGAVRELIEAARRRTPAHRRGRVPGAIPFFLSSSSAVGLAEGRRPSREHVGRLRELDVRVLDHLHAVAPRVAEVEAAPGRIVAPSLQRASRRARSSTTSPKWR